MPALSKFHAKVDRDLLRNQHNLSIRLSKLKFVVISYDTQLRALVTRAI